MNKKTFCKKHNLTEAQFTGREGVNRLDLSSLTSIPDSFNPTVGGHLYLSGLTSVPDSFNPTVGGDLYLKSLTSIPDSFNPTVGGHLYLSRRDINFNKRVPILFWQGKKFCSADGIFAGVVSWKVVGPFAVYKVRKIGSDKVFYLVEGGGKTAHGSSVKAAVADLRFKEGGRDKSDYEGLTLESELSFTDAVVCYRVITGACSFGVSEFIESRLKLDKGSYKISEIISLTQGEYGSEKFKRFFNC